MRLTASFEVLDDTLTDYVLEGDEGSEYIRAILEVKQLISRIIADRLEGSVAKDEREEVSGLSPDLAAYLKCKEAS